MKTVVQLKLKTVKPSAGFIGRIPEEFDKLPADAVIQNLKTKEIYKKKKKKWIKLS
jgi:hypothetical protein